MRALGARAKRVAMPNVIALSVPFFFLLIGGELLWARRKGLRVYRSADTVGDLGCGIAQQLVLVLAGTWLLSLHTRLYEHRLLTLSSPLAQWAVALVGVDFAYYWWHRLSHRVNLLWAVHVVHHQSEDYNLAVALRQAVLSSFTSFPFYAPLALLGVSPLVYLAANGLDTVYQFWIHTELVGKIGPLERVLNTPSHHRVHHGMNWQYLDKNYGGILISWDRLFGTFAEEKEKPVYGTTKPLRSFDPIFAQLAYFWELWERARALPRLADRLKLLAMPPEWSAGDGDGDAGADLARPKHESPAPARWRLYAVAQLGPVVAATFLLMIKGPEIPLSLSAAAVLLLVLSLAALGALLDGRRWGWPLELARWGAAATAGAAWAAGAFAS